MPIRQILERCDAFADVPAPVLDRLAFVASLSNYVHGERLWQAGDEARQLAVIRNGLVKIVREHSRGRSALCGLFGPFEAIGIVPLLKGVPFPASAVVATNNAQVITLARAEVLAALDAHPAFARSLACSMHSKLTALHDKISRGVNCRIWCPHRLRQPFALRRAGSEVASSARNATDSGSKN